MIAKDMIYMYNYSLKRNEKILFETMNAVCECNKEKKNIAIIITNIRLLIFQDINKNSYIDVLNITRNGYTLPNLELVLEIDKQKIESVKYIDDGTELVVDEKNIFIFDLNLFNFFSDKSK